MFYGSHSQQFDILRYNLQVPSDNFTNQTLLHMILNEYLGDNPNYLYQFDSFYCLDEKGYVDGYNITEFSNSEDLSKFISNNPLTDEILGNIIIQIMTPLFVLKHPKIGFLHSDLKPKNIFVNQIENGNYQFKLADFDKSSIFYRNIRFYNNHFNYTLSSTGDLLNKTPFPLLISETKPSYEYYSMGDTNFYGKHIGFHEFIMSNPQGFYSSFDIYTFFYSLILEQRVYLFLKDRPKSFIWLIYEYLFHHNEKDEWNKFITNIREINDRKISGDITSIKFYWQQFKDNNFKLRYNVDYIYELLEINKNSIKGKFPQKTLDLIEITEPSNTIFYISNDHHLCTINPDEKIDNTCRTNIYSKISKDPRDFGRSYLYGYDDL
jgi:hypothetical protein